MLTIQVEAEELPINNEIIYNLQNIMNLFPNLNLEGLIQVSVRSLVLCRAAPRRAVPCSAVQCLAVPCCALFARSLTRSLVCRATFTPQSIFVKTNDMYLVIYVSSIIRSVTALHDLLQNKIRFDEVCTVAVVLPVTTSIVSLLRLLSTDFLIVSSSHWCMAWNCVAMVEFAGDVDKSE